MTVKARFIQQLKSNYPLIEQNYVLNDLISDQLLSEKIVELPISYKNQIRDEITGYQKLKKWSNTHLEEQYKNLGLEVPNNEAVCSSYDFHITTENQLKLIEINTNASFLALGIELYKTQNVNCDFNEVELLKMFQIENGNEKLHQITIVDEKPEQQRLFIEFLLYKNIFENNKIQCEIKDVSEVQNNYTGLIYNRSTDFFLNESKSAVLKELFNSKKIILSPNPYEYMLLADKQRLIDWNNQSDVEKPSSLLRTYDLGLSDKDEIWSLRKNLFFKPKNSFGSKQAYKGANISRKTFDEFFGPTMIAQAYAQPAEIDVFGAMMKFDLRCFAYQGKLQLVIARLYQGQTTNLRTEGGGFAVVDFR